MENHKLVLPANLNHFGFLFGGDLLKWVDEYAWIAVSLDYPECAFVTVGFDKVEFKKSVRSGTILKFVVEKTQQGRTSVQYRVTVFRGIPEGEGKDPVFTTQITFVHVDKDGKKKPIPG